LRTGADRAAAVSRLRVGERGKSELHRAGRWVTPRGGDPTDSATENIPPLCNRGKGEMAR